MALLILYCLAQLTTTDTDVQGLQASAPQDLTISTARTNMISARVAGSMYAIDPDLLLSIAWHESRFQINVRTRLPTTSLQSCGVMTPTPVASAQCAVQSSSTLAGYLAGASHLRTWLNASHNNVELALGGVSGGYHFIAACRTEPTRAVCRTPQVFLARARRIRALREHYRRGVS